jgi:hypothetical protein
MDSTRCHPGGYCAGVGCSSVLLIATRLSAQKERTLPNSQIDRTHDPLAVCIDIDGFRIIDNIQCVALLFRPT